MSDIFDKDVKHQFANDVFVLIAEDLEQRFPLQFSKLFERLDRVVEIVYSIENLSAQDKAFDIVQDFANVLAQSSRIEEVRSLLRLLFIEVSIVKQENELDWINRQIQIKDEVFFDRNRLRELTDSLKYYNWADFKQKRRKAFEKRNTIVVTFHVSGSIADFGNFFSSLGLFLDSIDGCINKLDQIQVGSVKGSILIYFIGKNGKQNLEEKLIRLKLVLIELFQSKFGQNIFVLTKGTLYSTLFKRGVEFNKTMLESEKLQEEINQMKERGAVDSYLQKLRMAKEYAEVFGLDLMSQENVEFEVPGVMTFEKKGQIIKVDGVELTMKSKLSESGKIVD